MQRLQWLLLVVWIPFALAQTAPSGRIAGVVHGPDGNVLSEATVTLRNVAGVSTLWQTHSDTNGKFTFKNVPPGDYTLTVQKRSLQEHQEQIVVATGRSTAVFVALGIVPLPESDHDTALWEDLQQNTANTSPPQLARPPKKIMPPEGCSRFDEIAQQGRIVGIVYSPEGNELFGVKFTLTSGSLLGGPRTQRSSDDGSFVFNCLPPGKYNLKAEYPNLKTSNKTSLVIRAGKTSPLYIPMQYPFDDLEDGYYDECYPVVDTGRTTQGFKIDSAFLRAVPH